MTSKTEEFKTFCGNLGLYFEAINIKEISVYPDTFSW